ncbi:LytR family transcriptional attenuator [Melghirimyces profundicolus]|uniref:LytR family transcriptional attenuator n=1 Tax=Melghirimyces profundicolus TaxID=1242148 RepID=A0A2T6C2K4_9BACL|nr:LCP family protein [Melghirimyces profundicolus]PTX62562.1 LytR family transcriptional attenuator [Melghirimyces profundicolus]
MGRYNRKTLLAVVLALGVVILFRLQDPENPPSAPETPPSTPSPAPIRDRNTPDDPAAPRLRPPSPLDRPVSLLLIGVDQRKEDVGRADALLVLTVNPSSKTVKVLNIPRDTKTWLIRGNGQRLRRDKINHSYSLGHGAKSTVKTVENFLNIPIHDYIKMNFAGFRSVIDLFGGVDVRVRRNFSYKGHHFRKGPMTLNGAQALAYIRDRTGGSDYDRHERQQQVLNSLWEKGTRWSTIMKLDELFRIVRRHSETSLSFPQAWRTLGTVREIPKEKREVLRLRGKDEWSSHYYLVVPEGERSRVSRVLREHLEIESHKKTGP